MRGKVLSSGVQIIMSRITPPMRGKDLLMKYVVTLIGITPAYAGKSFELKANSIFCQDHPRLCGEKYGTPRMSKVDAGSPPPMRGKVEEIIMRKIDVRITPAYAGKSQLQSG